MVWGCPGRVTRIRTSDRRATQRKLPRAHTRRTGPTAMDRRDAWCACQLRAFLVRSMMIERQLNRRRRRSARACARESLVHAAPRQHCRHSLPVPSLTGNQSLFQARSPLSRRVKAGLGEWLLFQSCVSSWRIPIATSRSARRKSLTRSTWFASWPRKARIQSTPRSCCG